MHSCPCMHIHVQMNVCVDNDTSWPCSFSRVSHMLRCSFIGLPSELCGVSLNAPRRSRPGSQATVCRWSRYLCQGRASPSHQPPRVGPLGSTSTVRNGLGCGNMGHKIILTSPPRVPIVNTDKRSHAHRGAWHEEDTSVYTNARARCTLTVHKLLSLKLFFVQENNVVLYGLCSVSQWSVVKA